MASLHYETMPLTCLLRDPLKRIVKDQNFGCQFLGSPVLLNLLDWILKFECHFLDFPELQYEPSIQIQYQLGFLSWYVIPKRLQNSMDEFV